MDDKAMLSEPIDTEIELLKHLSHPNIVPFTSCWMMAMVNNV
jgi:hypothetical protein